MAKPVDESYRPRLEKSYQPVYCKRCLDEYNRLTLIGHLFTIGPTWGDCGSHIDEQEPKREIK